MARNEFFQTIVWFERNMSISFKVAWLDPLEVTIGFIGRQFGLGKRFILRGHDGLSVGVPLK